MRKRSRLLTILPLLFCLAAHKSVADQWDRRNYKPPEFPQAENHLQVRFLPEARDWERIDVYVPKDRKEDRLPCVLLYYGGGWGGKVPFPEENHRVLLAKGYVVAVPDYILGADHPVPLVAWDGAAAVRFLRTNAEKFHIDPERIGAMGLSAGGWLLQYQAPSDSRTVMSFAGKQGEKPFVVPVLDPHPASSDQSAQLRAFVSDWGCGTLADANMHKANPGWLGPDDPPLLTCLNRPAPPQTEVQPFEDAKEAPVVRDSALPLVGGPKLYRDSGAVAEVAFVNHGMNTHCLVGAGKMKDIMVEDKGGKLIPFGERTVQFLDEYVAHPARAAAPEMFPHGGPIHKSGKVVIRTVHREARIHYTTNGNAPDASSRVYGEPIEVTPGTVLQAIAVRQGLAPSPITTGRFTSCSVAPPVIVTQDAVLKARATTRFEKTFEAKSVAPVEWYIVGEIGKTVSEDSTQGNQPRFAMDAASGRLTGTPMAPGRAVLIVTALVRDGNDILVDARQVTIVIEQ